LLKLFSKKLSLWIGKRGTKVRSGLSLRVKISIMIILILAFALLLNVFLNFFNFEKNYSNMIYSRFFVIAKDLQNTAEYGLDLGLSLPELKNLQEVISGVVTEHKDIISIIIFNAEGQAIFHTDPEEVDKGVPAKWVEKLKEMDREATSELTYNDTFVIALPLLNTFNIKVGTLALSFSKSHIEIPVRQMFLYLFRWSFVFLIAFAAITFVGVSLFSRDIVGIFGRMRSSLEDFLQGRPHDFERSESIADLQEELIAFQEKSTEVLQKIHNVSKELKRIDDEGTVK
jgi:sensor histidine kinase regulating citrate/malate metabolism